MKKDTLGGNRMLTVNQRDMLALYLLKEGIRSEANITKQLNEYEEIRGIVGRIAEELEKCRLRNC